MRADNRAATLVLAAMVLSLGMLTVDVTVVRVALETIQHDLGLSDAAEQWVVNAYLLTLGVFAIAGGRAGDLLGRRVVFLVGLALFTGGSGGCALAPSGGALIAARAVQGIGAAIMSPGVFAIVTDAFAGRHLGRAIGILTGTARRASRLDRCWAGSWSTPSAGAPSSSSTCPSASWPSSPSRRWFPSAASPTRRVWTSPDSCSWAPP